MAGLPKQLITVPLTGLQTKADPKSAPTGVLQLAENCWASRRTAGGIEVRKRYGFTGKTRNILGGGALAAGHRLGVLNDELVLCDGLKAYSLSLVLDKWITRGRFQSIAADLRIISGDQGPKKPNVASAYAGGYACYVVSSTSGSGLTTIYMVDTSTGEVIGAASGLPFIYRARVVTLGGDFYVFSWNGINSIECQKISGSAPTTFPITVSTVATNANTNGVFDVAVNPTAGNMVVVYENTTPTMTLKIWTTGMTAGTAVAYASIDPVGAAGFLQHDFADGFGYVGVTTLTEVHVIKFDATALTVPGGGDVTLETLGAPADMPQITGYRNTATTKVNLQWTVGTGQTSRVRAATKADAGSVTLFNARLSVGLASKVFKVGTAWYLFAGYQASSTEFSTNPSQYGQMRTFLLQLDEDTAGAAGTVNVAGYLMGNDSGGLPRSRACLPAAALASSTRALFPAAGLQAVAPIDATAQSSHFSLVQIDLDFTGAALGRPLTFNGVLHMPAAAAKYYDGHFVVEEGFWVEPEAPLNPTAGTGGNLELLGTYQYCCVWARPDKAGRLLRSSPGELTTVILTGSNNKITLDIPTLRMTDATSLYNLNPQVLQPFIEVYRTQDGLPNMYLCAVLTNNAAVDTISFEDIMSDDNLIKNDELYTAGGVLDHIAPPAVKLFHRHGDRLVAITGDGSWWHTKASREGFGTEWSDDFRAVIEEGEGAPVAVGSVDSTLVLFKRNRTFLTAGAGPDVQGNNPFPTPVPLGDDAGAVSPGAVIETSQGLLGQVAEGLAVARARPGAAAGGDPGRLRLPQPGLRGLGGRAATDGHPHPGRGPGLRLAARAILRLDGRRERARRRLRGQVAQLPRHPEERRHGVAGGGRAVLRRHRHRDRRAGEGGLDRAEQRPRLQGDHHGGVPGQHHRDHHPGPGPQGVHRGLEDEGGHGRRRHADRSRAEHRAGRVHRGPHRGELHDGGHPHHPNRPRGGPQARSHQAQVVRLRHLRAGHRRC
jgi:hypothetical protein